MLSFYNYLIMDWFMDLALSNIVLKSSTLIVNFFISFFSSDIHFCFTNFQDIVYCAYRFWIIISSW